MKISVIVPSFNSVSTLELAIKSVLTQSHRDFELIVMDGGSQDGTRELLERYNSQITFWQSEKDKGTTDAMNAGFQKSTGELITFLCSDDRIYNDQVFGRVIQEFENHPETEVLCAGLEVFDPTGDVPTFTSFSKPDRLHRGMTVHLPGAFFRRETLNERSFDGGAEVANDYELFAYLKIERQTNIRVMKEITVSFSLGGRTNNPETDFWKARELFVIRRKYFGFWGAWAHYFVEFGTACLRKVHIRPYTWGRKLRRGYYSLVGDGGEK